MIEGEYVAQMPKWGRGAAAEDGGPVDGDREVTYAPTGTITISMRVDTPNARGGRFFVGRLWEELGAQVTVPEGCTAAAQWWSSPALAGPFSPRSPDPTLVPQDTFVHYELVMGASTDGMRAPTLQSGSPRVHHRLLVSDTLLGPDASEFPGGVVLGEVEKWWRRSKVSKVELPSGKVIRQGSGTPIGYMPGCLFQCFAEETQVALNENIEEGEFVIEAPTERLLVAPVGELTLRRQEGSYWIATLDGGGHYVYGWYEGAFEGYFEVLEAIPLAPLVGVGF